MVCRAQPPTVFSFVSLSDDDLRLRSRKPGIQLGLPPRCAFFLGGNSLGTADLMVM